LGSSREAVCVVVGGFSDLSDDRSSLTTEKSYLQKLRIAILSGVTCD